ncbi:MAG: NAD(P)/FAD-dependent oxidoreductase [Gammaproteobacteria bacterium]|nr:NAD(P)/FAD-dependent oxidoreductase [Gammaproteobacteria bacterium]
MRYVIVGNSYAGIGAVESIRELDPYGEIIIIADEPYRAYGRPLITYWIGGAIREDQMDYRPQSWYDDNRIETKLGQKVTQVDPTKQQVTLEDGETVAYDQLLIASGGTPIVPPIEGVDAEGLFTMTRFDEAKAFKTWTDQERVKAGVSIGAGLIGMSVFKAIKGIDVKLTLVELLDRVLGLALDYESSAMIEAELVKAGVDVRTSSAAEAILKDDQGRVEAVRMKGGEVIPCQTVVMAVGVRPNVGLLEGSGIEINRGVVVDGRMRTSVADIYAAGDVVEAKNVLNGTNQVIAILPLAYEQGRVAGYNMAGADRIYPGGIPLNSLPIFDLALMTMGITLTDDQPDLEVLVYQEEKVYRKLVFAGERLVGAILIGNVAYGGVLTWLIRSQRVVDYDREALLKGELVDLEAARQLGAAQKNRLWSTTPSPSLATR